MAPAPVPRRRFCDTQDGESRSARSPRRSHGGIFSFFSRRVWNIFLFPHPESKLLGELRRSWSFGWKKKTSSVLKKIIFFEFSPRCSCARSRISARSNFLVIWLWGKFSKSNFESLKGETKETKRRRFWSFARESHWCAQNVQQTKTGREIQVCFRGSSWSMQL